MATNPKTLFHLVPVNNVARNALLHPDNKRFVSQTEKGAAGLEIGYHVPSIPQGHVIARLGRNADLILSESTPQQPISAVHVAFEINPATHLVLLSARSKRASPVLLRLREHDEEAFEHDEVVGDGVLLYGQNYSIGIGSYRFGLIWRKIPNDGANFELLKTLAIDNLHTSMRHLQTIRSRDRPTEYDESEYLSWHVTRLNTAKSAKFEDVEHLREHIGSGAFGEVYKAVDRQSGHNFAIKVIDLTTRGNTDAARALIHREIKLMQSLKHKHIIDFLGYQDFHTTEPKILMPLCKGNLTSLAKSSKDQEHDAICTAVLEQGLSALDYLASKNLIHRDIKPDNILYCDIGKGQYLFKLADFGLAQHHTLAATFAGTYHYQAPELWPVFSNIVANQSSKMDIWSLFASIVAVHSNFPEFPPTDIVRYDKTLNALKKAASCMPRLEAMARLHPDSRASAAQLLVLLFRGRGMTTDRSRIPDIGPAPEVTDLHPCPSSATGSGKPRQNEYDLGKVSQVRTAARAPLIVYSPDKRRCLRAGPSYPAESAARPQLNPMRVHGGILKRQAEAKGNYGFQKTREDIGRRAAAAAGIEHHGRLQRPKQSDLKTSDEPHLHVPGMFPI